MAIASKVALAMASSAVGAAMLAGGSFAWFSSTASSTNNQFTAGTVEVGMNATGNIFSTAAHFNNLAPGDSSTNAGTFTITTTNASNVSSSLGEWVGIQNIETGALFSGSTPLAISYTVQVYSGTSTVGSPIQGTVSSASSDTYQTPFLLTPGETAQVSYSYSFPTTAGNSYQGATGSDTVNVQAVQARNNNNSTSTAPSNWS